MKKIWRVMIYEYLRHVLRKRFVIAVLSLPLVMVAMVVVMVIAVAVQYDGRPVGYVDQSGWLTNPVYPQYTNKDGPFATQKVQSYPSEKAAVEALKQKQIQAYYVIENDYLETGRLRMVAFEDPSEGVETAIESFLRYNLLNGQPIEVRERLLDGVRVKVTSLDGSRSAGGGQWLQLVVPVVAGILFVIVINTSGGYLMQAVVEEKENRTMEIVITSVSSMQLMAGKIIGNLSVGLTQLLIWLFFPILGFLVVQRIFPIGQQFDLSNQYVYLTVLVLAPAFVMIAALMAMVGATVTETREAQQVAGLFTLPIVAPYWLMNTLMNNPNGPVSVGMSLFPLTAPVSLPLRAAFTVVPGWQAALSVGLLYISAGASIWLAARAFRLGMLRYGKPLTWRELFGKAVG